MNALDLLQFLDPEVDPERTKIHLATYNGVEQPLEDVLVREPHWKNVLMTREHGSNAN